MLISILFAVEFTCNNTFIPSQCQGELYTECQYDQIRGSTLSEINQNVGKICQIECLHQFQRLDTCINTIPTTDTNSTNNPSNIATVCRDMWNVRCSRVNGNLCYQERLNYWINKGYANGDDVNNAIKSNSNPGMPCTDCQRTMLKYEETFDQFMLVTMKTDPFFSWSRANEDIARQSFVWK
eukprot:NODE_468_length_7060_cov_0.310157.p6 type:complete len:182 gc:universal NODE_468_length_7060_cov_0.310157:2760-2215(-)